MVLLNSREDFKSYRHVPGIYMFRNTINNKKYIGQAVDLNVRLLYHLSCIRRNKTNIHTLYKAINKYGIDNFELYILATFPLNKNLKYNLNVAEKIFIQFYDSYKNGYNSTIGGDGGTLGYKRTEEQRKKQSEYIKAHPIVKLEDNTAKKVYIFDMQKGSFYEFKSTRQASKELKSIGYVISDTSIANCARGKIKKTKTLLCSYSKEELKRKIQHYNNGN